MVKPALKPAVLREEAKYRDELFPDVKGIINKNLLCTSCNCTVRQLVQKGKPRSHPFLDTLLCEKCHLFYGDGEFSVDEDGSDKYCRWCGQGGTLYLCSKCTAGFCKKCIKRNLPRAVLKDVEEDDWECFSCNVKPLYELRAHSWAAQKYAKANCKDKSDSSTPKKRKLKKGESENEGSDEENTSKKAKKDRKSSDGDYSDHPSDKKTRRSDKKTKKSDPNSELSINDEEEPVSNKKSPAKKKSLKTKQLKLARSQMSNVLQDIVKLCEITKRKANDFNKKKVTPQKIYDDDSFNTSGETMIGMLQSVEDMAKTLRLNFTEFVSKWGTTVKEMDGEDENGVKEEFSEEKPIVENDEILEIKGSDEEMTSADGKNEEENVIGVPSSLSKEAADEFPKNEFDEVESSHTEKSEAVENDKPSECTEENPGDPVD